MDINSMNSAYNSIMTSQMSQSANKISNLSEEELKQASDDELLKVCKDFEAYFLEQVFKEMEKTTDLFGDEDDSDSTSQLVDFFKEGAIQDLASQSTEQNSLGLAQMLYEQMKRNYEI